MPRRTISDKSRSRYHALKRLNPLGMKSMSLDEFDQFMQYRTSYEGAGRAEEVNQVYSAAVDTLLAEMYAMMLEAWECDPERWEDRLAEMGNVGQQPGMRFIEARYVPQSKPSARVKKRSIYKNAQLAYMKAAEQETQQDGDDSHDGPVQLPLPLE